MRKYTLRATDGSYGPAWIEDMIGGEKYDGKQYPVVDDGLEWYRAEEVDQFIAELEEVIRESKELISAYQKGAEKATISINRLQADPVSDELLSDELLDELLKAAWHMDNEQLCTSHEQRDELKAILDLRRKNREADHA